MNIKQKASELKIKTAAVFIAFKRKDTPFIAKIFAGLTVAYALSPIDLIPDFIPVLGYLDDIIVLPLLIALSIKFIPKDIMKECEARAHELWAGGLPKKWFFAIPIIVIWTALIGFIIYKIAFC